MKPKNKIEKCVFELAQKLPDLTPSQVSFAYKSLFMNPCFVTKREAFCGMCGEKVERSKIGKHAFKRRRIRNFP